MKFVHVHKGQRDLTIRINGKERQRGREDCHVLICGCCVLCYHEWFFVPEWQIVYTLTHMLGLLKILSTLNSIMSLCLVMKTTWWIIHHQKDIVYTHTQVILPNYICFCGNMNDEIESVIYLVFEQMFHHHYFSYFFFYYVYGMHFINKIICPLPLTLSGFLLNSTLLEEHFYSFLLFYCELPASKK